MPDQPKSTDFAPRLKPPATLTKPQATVFRNLVASVSAGHFRPVDTVLLVEFARAAVLADQAAVAIANDGAVIDGKASAWIAVAEKATKSLVALSAKLRIGPQQRFDRLEAGVSTRQGLPEDWEPDDEPRTGGKSPPIADDDDDLLAKPPGYRKRRRP